MVLHYCQQLEIVHLYATNVTDAPASGYLNQLTLCSSHRRFMGRDAPGRQVALE